VVRLEATQPGARGHIVVNESVSPRKFITPRAAFARQGQTILAAGTTLTPVHVGVAATAGAARVTVHRQPRVALLANGDELVNIEQRPTGAQVRNSNQPLLEALTRSAHAEPLVLDFVGDNRTQLTEAIRQGLAADVLCITGGVSVGAFDFVPEVLREHGATFHVHKMAIKPGRPTIFATTAAGKLVFALPGNPVSAFVGFELLVRPALARLQGRDDVIPRAVRAKLIGALPGTADRRSFHPARAAITESGGWEVHTLSWHGSGDSLGMAGANALIERAPDSPAARNGEEVSIDLLDRNG
jgi:molybdopterin molybdotransferase